MITEIAQKSQGKAFLEKSVSVEGTGNQRYDYRRRAGRYRVLFDYDDEVRIVEIQQVRKRDGRTY